MTFIDRLQAKSGPIPVGLRGQFRRHAPQYVAGSVLLAVYQALMYGFDRGLWYGVDATLAGARERGLLVGIVLASASLLAMGVRVLSRILIFNGGRDAEYELRKVLLERLHALGPAFYRRMPTGEIMSRATNDLAQVRLLLGFGVLNTVNTVFALVSALAIVLSISVKLTLASLVGLPLIALVTRRYSRATFSLTRASQAALGKLSDRVQASFAGVRVIKSFALEERELSTFQDVNLVYLDKSLKLAQLRGSMFPVLSALGAVGTLIVFMYGGRLVMSGEISGGGFIAFFWALQRLSWPIMALGFIISMVARGRAAHARILELVEATPDVADGPLPAPDSIAGELEVRHLTFAYALDGAPVLRDVSLHIPARGSLALVGRTGSGKSTLAALLARILPTPRGTVFLDGADVCDLPVASVRRAIGYAQQDAFLFSNTVAHNIAVALADEHAPGAFDTIERCAREARVAEEVEALPEGFETVVGERGVQLSGGQKQRVALARSLAWRPTILVLDDPISAVDARTEAGILDTIESEAEERTILLITHRVAAARRCDAIAVLERGSIVEVGTHDELVRKGGLYARFAEEQMLEGQLESPDPTSSERPSSPPHTAASA